MCFYPCLRVSELRKQGSKTEVCEERFTCIRTCHLRCSERVKEGLRRVLIDSEIKNFMLTCKCARVREGLVLRCPALGKTLRPEEVSCHIIKQLVADAERELVCLLLLLCTAYMYVCVHIYALEGQYISKSTETRTFMVSCA
jgi:hypothetical protein